MLSHNGVYSKACSSWISPVFWVIAAKHASVTKCQIRCTDTCMSSDVMQYLFVELFEVCKLSGVHNHESGGY